MQEGCLRILVKHYAKNVIRRKLMRKGKNEKAKILFFDIETSNLAASMGFILSIGYKWAHENKVHLLRIDETKEYQKRKTDDAGLLKQFEDVYNEADVVVAHFGKYFDIPYLQTRRIIKNKIKMADVKLIDTWAICRKHMKFHSNRLDAVARALKCPYVKTTVDGEKWIDAMSGDKRALDYVVTHNKIDVLVLEWVFNKISAMLPSLPRLIWDRQRCGNCGGRMISDGPRVTQKNRHERWRCPKCGKCEKGRVL